MEPIKYVEHNGVKYVVDGNHENFDMLKKFDTVSFLDGKAQKISDKVYHLMRGQIYNIDKKTFFIFGGAASHDKESRKEGKNWWAEELPSKNEMNIAIHNLTSSNFKTDIVITHCAPSSIQTALFPSYPVNDLTDFLDNIKGQLYFEKWFFGHYHTDIMVDKKFQAVFNDIVSVH